MIKANRATSHNLTALAILHRLTTQTREGTFIICLSSVDTLSELSFSLFCQTYLCQNKMAHALHSVNATMEPAFFKQQKNYELQYRISGEEMALVSAIRVDFN